MNLWEEMTKAEARRQEVKKMRDANGELGEAEQEARNKEILKTSESILLAALEEADNGNITDAIDAVTKEAILIGSLTIKKNLEGGAIMILMATGSWPAIEEALAGVFGLGMLAGQARQRTLSPSAVQDGLALEQGSEPETPAQATQD